ncbi:MAG: hypothetical protein DMF89_26630 [Acidobacteria bacterium]|nr:MAG: hypothetical protein DMF89_26630 [Acidobacteriota bacterium]
MNRSSNLVAALFLVASGTLFAQTPTPAVPKEFDHVRTLGHALAEFRDDRVQIVAAYYYSQSNHDIPWLLIELGALWPRATEINRERIELVTPSGHVVRLATQARWAEDSTRNALLLQQATTSRHQVASYFQPYAQTHLRFFTRPPNDGTVQKAVYLRPDELGLSDLLFESPTRLWDKGTYALVIRYDGGEAVLPIELR